MTNPPLPTAAEALAEAVAIAKSMTNGVSSVERAHLWVAIARELRAGTMRPMRAASLLPGQLVPDELATDWAATARDLTSGDPERVAQHLPDFASGGVIPRKPPGRYDLTFEGENAAARAARLLRESAPEMQWPDPSAAETQVVSDPGKTQVIWAIGDKAQCRHCLTPIELCEAAIEPNAFVPDGGTAHMWRHKYTGHATCLAATMSSEASDVAHFAEPAPR